MINTFKGTHGFLSNFSPSLIRYEGLMYPTVEHAYQATKAQNFSEKVEICGAATPVDAKRMGKEVLMTPQDIINWNKKKLTVMEELLRLKFLEGSVLGRLLVDTGSHELVEGNWWGDTFWGVCRGVGENNLGKLLMKIRSDIHP